VVHIRPLGPLMMWVIHTHDDAHDAFMTLPPYTRTREDNGQPEQ
jgi:hypothetical protein